MSHQESYGHRVRKEHLSPGQARVLTLVLQGKTGTEIATELGWAISTVKNYRSILYEILEIDQSCRLLNPEIRQKALALIASCT